MSQETITFQTNTAGTHVLDTIVLPEEKAVLYTGQITTNNDVSLIQIKVVHDGATMGKTQQGMGLSDDPPVSINADVDGWNGKVTVTLTDVPAKIVLEKQIIPTELYGENTKSGKLIRHTSGCGYESESANGSMTVREANNNLYGDPNVVYESPTPSGPEIIINGDFSNDTSGWIPQNDAIMTVANGVATIECNNPIKDDFYYQQFEAELGYTYIIETEGNAGRVIVGSTLQDNNYVDMAVGQSATFSPNTVSNVFVTIGHDNSVVTGVSVKKYLPLHTFDQFEGTMFFKWANTSPSTDMAIVTSIEGYTYVLSIDANNNVVFKANDQVVSIIGEQLPANNYLCFTYGEGFVASLNGNDIVANLNMEVIDNMVELGFSIPILQFSYMPTVLSNTELVSFSNG